jgi:hypothetical protein
MCGLVSPVLIIPVTQFVTVSKQKGDVEHTAHEMRGVRGIPSGKFWKRNMFIKPNEYKNISFEVEYSAKFMHYVNKRLSSKIRK